MGIIDKINDLNLEMKVDKKVNDFFSKDNLDYISRMHSRYSKNSLNNDILKSIIKSEMLNSDIPEFKVNTRFLELIKLDYEKLYEDIYLKDIDTSQFTSRKDLDDYFGEDYALNFENKEIKLDTVNHLNRLKPLDNPMKHIKEETQVKFGPNMGKGSYKLNKSCGNFKFKSNEETESKKTETKQEPHKEIPLEKINLLRRGTADIEIFTNVKSNSALASAVLFAATGILVAEAKEEMNWVKTTLKIKKDRIIIKRPYSVYKYKDFRQLKSNHEENYYLIYIKLANEKVIYIRTKERYLAEIIIDISNMGRFV